MTTAQLCNGGTVNTLSILSVISVCGEQCRPGVSLVSLVTLQLESTTLMDQVMKLATLIQSWTVHTDIIAHNSVVSTYQSLETIFHTLLIRVSSFSN